MKCNAASTWNEVHWSWVNEELKFYQWKKIPDCLVQRSVASMCWPCRGFGDDEMSVFVDDEDYRICGGPKRQGDYRTIPTTMVVCRSVA